MSNREPICGTGIETVCSPRRVKHPVPELQKAIERLAAELRAVYRDLHQAEWIAQRLLAGDERIREAVQSGELAELMDGPSEDAELVE